MRVTKENNEPANDFPLLEQEFDMLSTSMNLDFRDNADSNAF